VGGAAEFRKRAAECFQWAVGTQTLAGASTWLTMAQSWLERAQLAEKEELNSLCEAAPAGGAVANSGSGDSLPGQRDENRGQPDRE